ncbi:hypothetical protein NX059_001717 [Plenodomus lindquistii]|nr:hypothetical protein NX059_001717 [Plenodomus lindquistii]
MPGPSSTAITARATTTPTATDSQLNRTTTNSRSQRVRHAALMLASRNSVLNVDDRHAILREVTSSLANDLEDVNTDGVAQPHLADLEHIMDIRREIAELGRSLELREEMLSGDPTGRARAYFEAQEDGESGVEREGSESGSGSGSGSTSTSASQQQRRDSVPALYSSRSQTFYRHFAPGAHDGNDIQAFPQSASHTAPFSPTDDNAVFPALRNHTAEPTTYPMPDLANPSRRPERIYFPALSDEALGRLRVARHIAGLDTTDVDREILYRVLLNPHRWGEIGRIMVRMPWFQPVPLDPHEWGDEVDGLLDEVGGDGGRPWYRQWGERGEAGGRRGEGGRRDTVSTTPDADPPEDIYFLEEGEGENRGWRAGLVQNDESRDALDRLQELMELGLAYP